jgi:hypothetical protein
LCGRGYGRRGCVQIENEPGACGVVTRAHPDDAGGQQEFREKRRDARAKQDPLQRPAKSRLTI